MSCDPCFSVWRSEVTLTSGRLYLKELGLKNISKLPQHYRKVENLMEQLFHLCLIDTRLDVANSSNVRLGRSKTKDVMGRAITQHVRFITLYILSRRFSKQQPEFTKTEKNWIKSIFCHFQTSLYNHIALSYFKSWWTNISSHKGEILFVFLGISVAVPKNDS